MEGHSGEGSLQWTQVNLCRFLFKDKMLLESFQKNKGRNRPKRDLETRFLQSRHELLKNQIGLITVCWQTVSEDIVRACGQMEMGRNRKSGHTVTLSAQCTAVLVICGHQERRGRGKFLSNFCWLVSYSLRGVKSQCWYLTAKSIKFMNFTYRSSSFLQEKVFCVSEAETRVAKSALEFLTQATPLSQFQEVAILHDGT